MFLSLSSTARHQVQTFLGLTSDIITFDNTSVCGKHARPTQGCDPVPGGRLACPCSSMAALSWAGSGVGTFDNHLTD